MAWSQLTDDSVELAIGSQLRVTVTFERVPFTSPDDASVIDDLNDSGKVVVTNVKQAFLDPGLWTIELRIQEEPTTVGALRALVVSALNYWYTFAVQVQKVEINVGGRPSDLLPDTSTAVALAAVAIIAVVGYMAFRRIT